MLFILPPAILLLAALAVGLLSGQPLVGAGLAVGAMSYVAVFMLAQALTQLNWFRVVLGRRQRSADEIAEESLPGWNWSVPLLHHDGNRGDDLIDLATSRMRKLVEADIRIDSGHRGGEPDSILVREVLVVLIHGVTTRPMRRAVESVMDKPYGPGARVVVRPPSGPFTDFRKPVRDSGGFLFYYLGGSALVLTICAYLVSTWEAASCAGGTCAGRPATFASAAHWLAWRLLLQDPAGLSAATPQSLVVGWLVSIVALMTLPVAYVSVRLAIDAQRRSALVLPTILEKLMANTRVLLLTVTPPERDAVLAAVHAITGKVPERMFVGNHVIYELGVVRNAVVAMVQCPHQGATGPGGSIMTTSEVIRRWRPHFVIMVGICFGLRDDWRTPQRLGDVLVSTAVYDLDRKVVYDNGDGDIAEELQGDRTSAPSVLIGRLNASSTDWPTAAVYFGLMLTSGSLVSSKAHRDRLRNTHSRAIGGDMEGHGVYAAAAEARVAWILVKAISDWGVDREAHYEPALAAQNSAAFIAHALAIGAFDDNGLLA